MPPLRDIVGYFVKDPSHKVVRYFLQNLSAMSYINGIIYLSCCLGRLDARAGRNQLFCKETDAKSPRPTDGRGLSGVAC